MWKSNITVIGRLTVAMPCTGGMKPCVTSWVERMPRGWNCWAICENWKRSVWKTWKSCWGALKKQHMPKLPAFFNTWRTLSSTFTNDDKFFGLVMHSFCSVNWGTLFFHYSLHCRSRILIIWRMDVMQHSVNLYVVGGGGGWLTVSVSFCLQFLSQWCFCGEFFKSKKVVCFSRFVATPSPALALQTLLWDPMSELPCAQPRIRSNRRCDPAARGPGRWERKDPRLLASYQPENTLHCFLWCSVRAVRDHLLYPCQQLAEFWRRTEWTFPSRSRFSDCHYVPPPTPSRGIHPKQTLGGSQDVKIHWWAN